MAEKLAVVTESVADGYHKTIGRKLIGGGWTTNVVSDFNQAFHALEGGHGLVVSGMAFFEDYPEIEMARGLIRKAMLVGVAGVAVVSDALGEQELFGVEYPQVKVFPKRYGDRSLVSVLDHLNACLRRDVR